MTASKSKTALEKNAAAGKRFGIVVSRYHEDLTKELASGAASTLEHWGAKAEDIVTVWVPGSFEIPLAARAMAAHEFDAILCLGIIVKGDTDHNEYIAREAARGISALAQGAGLPVIFGILTTQTLEQAKDRCGGSKGHKGIEAAEAAVSMIQTLESIKKNASKKSKSVGFGNL